MKSKSKSKTTSNNSTPMKSTSLNNNSKEDERKIILDKILDKLNENKLYTIAIAIFLELKANNYEPILSETIYKKIMSDFNKKQKKFLKFGKGNEYYDLEKQVSKAIIISLNATHALKKIKKNNETFIAINFKEAENYLKAIKNIKISTLVKNYFSDISVSNNSSVVMNPVSNNNVKNVNNQEEDENEHDDFSISIDSNFIGNEEKQMTNKNENEVEAKNVKISKNNFENFQNNENSFNDFLINDSNSNNKINLGNGVIIPRKKRKYIRHKKPEEIKRRKFKKLHGLITNDSDSEEIKLLDNFLDIMPSHMTNALNLPLSNNGKGVVKRHYRKHKKNKMKLNNEKDPSTMLNKKRGRPKQEMINRAINFISRRENENVNNKSNNENVIEIIEESSEDIKSKQISNYLENLYSITEFMNNNNLDKKDENNDNNSLSKKSLDIISKIKVLSGNIEKIENDLDLLNNAFNQTPIVSTYNSSSNESETSPTKKTNEINDDQKQKKINNMKNYEMLLNLCYNNLEMNIKSIINAKKFSFIKNNEILSNHQKMLKEYEKKYDEILEKFCVCLSEINESFSNIEINKILEEIMNVKEELKKDGIEIKFIEDFTKKLETYFGGKITKYFNPNNVKLNYIEKKNKLLSTLSESGF